MYNEYYKTGPTPIGCLIVVAVFLILYLVIPDKYINHYFELVKRWWVYVIVWLYVAAMACVFVLGIWYGIKDLFKSSKK